MVQGKACLELGIHDSACFSTGGTLIGSGTSTQGRLDLVSRLLAAHVKVVLARFAILYQLVNGSFCTEMSDNNKVPGGSSWCRCC
jgi:hypothetical protein